MTAGNETSPDGGAAGATKLEPRWPVALAISGFIVITVVLRVTVPSRQSFGPHWLVPAFEIALLVVLLAAHPRSDAERVRLRRLSIVLILLLVASAIGSTVILIAELIMGSPVVQSADSLLAAGTLVWTGNALVFGLLYWELDAGGPLARYRHERPHPDFAFPQQMNPELAPPGWRPRYVDYFTLGVTTSMAFSPTDAMPMAPWTKLMMTLQSVISLVVVGLVIARAINVLQ
jgi:hypothetical protein